MKLDLKQGGYVRVFEDDDQTWLEVGYEDGHAAVAIDGLDELDAVVFLIANNELPESA